MLILGASGLLGRELMRVLPGRGHDVVGAGHDRARGQGLHAIDARQPDEVDALLDQVRPSVVVNAIGERRPEFWTPEILEGVNVRTAAHAARGCRRLGCWLVHVSSDYVFDGSDPPYRPDSERRPSNAYGAAKMQAEDQVRAEYPQATVLRLPVLYGPVLHLDESNMTSLVPTVMNAAPAAIDDWAVRYPTLTTDVAHVVADMLGHAHGLSGQVCHWSAAEALTKFAMASLIGRILGMSTNHLEPDQRPSSSRPQNPFLESSLLENLGVAHRTPLESALPGLLHQARRAGMLPGIPVRAAGRSPGRG
ncbi:dTDP-4-dehydrorhamnose reductase family protein [Dactylosporangium matsuzakiense]|uniref:dTDP-4-dehydrorhamnose reductase family protein n=1 Tax=Dactylosporangium matsuzakiense TaxID=53360 RepID=UPI0022F3436C|nr:SDR family oxidoreductase [Dactylosporangium matsuzakiense]